MPCVPTFSVRPHSSAGFVIIASWPKGHVEQLVGVFETLIDAKTWVARHSSDYVEQLGPPSKRVVRLEEYRKN